MGIEEAEVILVEVKVLMSTREIKPALFKRSANIEQGMIHLTLVAGIAENQKDLTHDHDQDQDLEIVANRRSSRSRSRERERRQRREREQRERERRDRERKERERERER